MRRSCLALASWLGFIIALVFVPLAAIADPATRVIVLGTGTPVTDPDRAGAGIAIVYGGEAYLFDIGRGVVQRALQARDRYGIPELEVQKIDHLFVTHLHSDHLHDYTMLGSARWWDREQSLQAWGPAGLEEMTEHANAMLDVEARVRAAGTPDEGIVNPGSHRIMATDIAPGVVFEKDGMTVEAFTVPHGNIKPALGYKVTTPDKVIVISGDTGFSEEIIRQAKGADLLLHEVISAEGMKSLPEHWQRYHSASHTPTDRLAEVATRAKPAKLVLYHILFMGRTAEQVLVEVRSAYNGDVVLANDLDIF
jgi:ribonuclease Z